MKLSVSLSADDVRVLDGYMRSHGIASRSAALQRAVRGLQDESLIEDYAQAFAEWRESGDAGDWDSTASDGIDDAPR